MPQASKPELNWEAAIQFISRTQNLKETNDLPETGDDGSFNYFPGQLESRPPDYPRWQQGPPWLRIHVLCRSALHDLC